MNVLVLLVCLILIVVLIIAACLYESFWPKLLGSIFLIGSILCFSANVPTYLSWILAIFGSTIILGSSYFLNHKHY